MAREVSGYNPVDVEVRARVIEGALRVRGMQSTDLSHSVTYDKVRSLYGVSEVFAFTRERAVSIGTTLARLRGNIGTDVDRSDAFTDASLLVMQQMRVDGWYPSTAAYLQERGEGIPQFLTEALVDRTSSADERFILNGRLYDDQSFGNILRLLYLASAADPLSLNEIEMLHRPNIVPDSPAQRIQLLHSIEEEIPARLSEDKSPYEVVTVPPSDEYKEPRYYLDRRAELTDDVPSSDKDAEIKKPHVHIEVQTDENGIPLSLQFGEDDIHLPGKKRGLEKVRDALIILSYFAEQTDDNLVPVNVVESLFTGKDYVYLSVDAIRTRIRHAFFWIKTNLKVDNKPLLAMTLGRNNYSFGPNGITFDIQKTIIPSPNAEK